MAEHFKDGFDHYGGDVNRMLDGAWAEIIGNPVLSQDNPRTGPYSLFLQAFSTGSGSTVERGVRRVLKNTVDEIIISESVFIPELPGNPIPLLLFQLRAADNTANVTLSVGPIGDLLLKQGQSNGTVIAQTNAPALVAGTHHHVETRVVRSETVGVCEIRVDNVVKLLATGLNTGSLPFAQIILGVSHVGPIDGGKAIYIDDLIVRDTTGTANNSFEGDARVLARYPVSDAVAQGWAARRRHNIGTGILSLIADNDDCVSCADAADLEIGSSDFTIEGFVRFLSLPTGSNKVQIAGKWQESGNQRSWQLFKAGPDIFSGRLVFRISTDGQAGTVTEIHSQPWEPELNVWYHWAVSRNSGTSRLFVGGVQLGTDKADSNTYFDGTAALAIGAEMSSVSAVIANTSVDGFMDEVRFTNGVGRYTADFTPTAVPFPRSAPSDPNFASVVLLSGFDNGIDDESSVGRTVTARNGAAMLTPDDADFNYQVIDDPSPIDDTFIEAALVAATGILTLTANPADTETVTLGSQTYTFNTALGGVDSILIGATADDSLDNLVAAVTNGAGEGTLYGTGTTANASVTAAKLPDPQVMVTALAPGAAGNSIATTETLANGSFTAATLQGGADIPGPSEFVLEPLPADATAVLSVTLINRGFKASSGDSEVTLSLVTAGGSSDAGTPKPMTLNPTNWEDVFERDPATLGPLTPSTMVGAKVRINRTT